MISRYSCSQAALQLSGHQFSPDVRKDRNLYLIKLQELIG